MLRNRIAKARSSEMVGNTIAAARIAASAKPAGVVRTVALTDTALPIAREIECRLHLLRI
jgi:hypothetical protein